MNPAAIGGCVAAIVVLAAHALRRSSARALVTQPPARRHSASTGWIVAIVPIAAAAVVLGPFVAACVMTGALVVVRWRAVRAVTRRRRRIEAAYPDAIDLVVLAVRAGFLPGAALAAATPHVPACVRGAFAAVTTRVAEGERFADALGALDELGPIARPLIDTFAAADRYGLALAPVLERLAHEARQQRRRAADAAARQLPVRLSTPLVLCTLPSFVLLAIVPLLLGAFSSLHVP